MSLLPSKSAISILINRNVVFVMMLTGLLYLLAQIFFFNHTLIFHTLFGNFPFSYKFQLSWNLVTGYFYMFPLGQIIANIFTACLVGWNMALSIAVFQQMRNSGKVKLSLGGMGVIAVMSSGCPSCGLTLFSLLGPSGSVFAVALHNPLVQISVVTILVLSILYNLNRLEKSTQCQVIQLKK